MTRTEFSKATKRAALERSGQICEARGKLYSLHPGERCGKHLSWGVEFDHVIACSNGGDNSLDNCLAICPACHGWKTRNLDTPRAAKIKRQSDKHKGVTKPKQTIRQRKALKAVAEKGSSHHAYLERMSAKGKPVPQRRIT
jgi:5-methylcytosine-specific restriction protein A